MITDFGGTDLGRGPEPGTGLERLRAANPSPMTGTGTNTYLLRAGEEMAVIDPGPDLAPHLAAILARTGSAHLSMILVTHAHLDHSALARSLAEATGAPVLAFGPAGSGRSALMQGLEAQGLTGGGEGIDRSFAPDRLLADGEILPFGTGHIEAIHTPGHMGGHLSFAWGGRLFSGDHAMGWASSLVSPPEGDMGAYMRALERLLARDWQEMLPGHGEAVAPVAPRLAALLEHRREREASVRAALRDGPATAKELTARIYADTPAALLPAAERNVLAHLIDLVSRNEIATEPPLTAASRFQAL